jgi:peptide/nickel transport system permease protein
LARRSSRWGGEREGFCIPTGDFPAIAGVTSLLGVTYVIANETIELLKGCADPRIVS